MTEDCVCGDVRDEHEKNSGPCTVEGCDCIMFEEADDDDDDD